MAGKFAEYFINTLLGRSDQDVRTEQLKREYPEVAKALSSIAQAVWIDPASEGMWTLSTAFAPIENIGATTAYVVKNNRFPEFLHIRAPGTKKLLPLSEPFIYFDKDIYYTRIPKQTSLSSLTFFHLPENTNLTPMPGWRRPEIGETVFYIGFPEPESNTQTIFRKPAIMAYEVTNMDVFAIEMHPKEIMTKPQGAFGGPIVDREGNLVGMGDSYHPQTRNVFAIPAQTIATMMDRLL